MINYFANPGSINIEKKYTYPHKFSNTTLKVLVSARRAGYSEELS